MSQTHYSKYSLRQVALIPYSQQFISLYCVMLQSFTTAIIVTTVKPNKTMIKKIVT